MKRYLICKKANEVMRGEPSDLLNRQNRKGFKFSRLSSNSPKVSKQKEAIKRLPAEPTKTKLFESYQESTQDLHDYITVKKSELNSTRNEDAQFAQYVRDIKRKIKEARLTNQRMSEKYDRESRLSVFDKRSQDEGDHLSVYSSIPSLHHLVPKNY